MKYNVRLSSGIYQSNPFILYIIVSLKDCSSLLLLHSGHTEDTFPNRLKIQFLPRTTQYNNINKLLVFLINSLFLALNRASIEKL